MTTRVKFVPDPTRMFGSLVEAPAFPLESFFLNIPEVIGDTNQFVSTGTLAPNWIDLGNGSWRTGALVPGELEFVLTVTTGIDTADIHVSLTNRSNRNWDYSFAGHCFNSGNARPIADHECARHWTRTGQEFRRLIELPRKYSGRPTVQIYNVEGAPPAMFTPFAQSFDATPNVVLEDWLAIRSRDWTRLVAVVSRPTLMLFQNMELSCIHSLPSFGPMTPGTTREATTRVYLVEMTLEDWYVRMRQELG